MNNKTEILSSDELKSLKKELKTTYFTSILIYLMILIIGHLLVYSNYEKWILPHFELLIVCGLATIIYLLTLYHTSALRKEIIQGNKLILFKTIDNKFDYIDKQDRFSSEYTKFVIIADRVKYPVSEDQYKNAEKSDFLALHQTPIREKTIKIEIVKSPAHNTQ